MVHVFIESSKDLTSDTPFQHFNWHVTFFTNGNFSMFMSCDEMVREKFPVFPSPPHLESAKETKIFVFFSFLIDLYIT